MMTRIVKPLAGALAPLWRFATGLVSSAALFLIVMAFTLAQARAFRRRVPYGKPEVE